MNVVPPKRHHYIPQFYLRGFTNEEGNFFVFDKKTEEIRKSNPLNSFFENHRNTGTIKSEKSPMLEHMYAYWDNETAPHLQSIRDAKAGEFVLEPETLHRLRMFIIQMYWRIPESDEEIEKLIDTLSFKEAGFDIKNIKTGESMANEEMQKELKSVDLFRKMYRLILPFISSQEKHKRTDYENWTVGFRGNRLHLTSDNPLVIEKFVDFGSLNGELLFPLSADKLLIHTTRPVPKKLPSLFLLDLDILIIQQATRFVCCSDRAYLEYLVNNLYSYSKNHDLIGHMTERIFDHFK